MLRKILLAMPFILMLSYFPVMTYVVDYGEVRGQSMNPVIQDGADRIGLKVLGPKRGEISFWNCGFRCEGALIGKYTLAVPGDHLKIDGEDIYVNGKVSHLKGRNFDQYERTMGEDEYFLIGANTYHSTDSRDLGTFSADDHHARALHFIQNDNPFVQAQENGW